MRIGGLSAPGRLFYGPLIVAIVGGVIVGGGAGTTAAGIAGAILALTIVGKFGVGTAEGDGIDRRGSMNGRELDEEAERRRRD
jgi:hypothetical protein